MNNLSYVSNSIIQHTSPVYSICDHQISSWFREIFKYNTVIS